MTTAEDAVLSVIAQEREAVESGDSDMYLAVLTDDAIFMPPNTLPKTGAELRTWLKGFVGAFRVEWLSYVSSEVVQSADLAYHAFTYAWRVTPRAGGEPTVSAGKGIHLLQLQGDGSWKIAREIWNANPASA
ncbi:MAG: DUF4440 domain-containing protein [Candidatus Latescibacteria bacterium]|nr:DUF4440 domain-containing protein [Candidatus Latescibacterota bacterium]NIO57331.1 DUF4440 domain-containing protein [Candidatus Latescibacterota bacterium]